MSRYCILFLLFSLSFFNVSAQPSIKAVYTASAPEIDGLIDDEVWKSAPVITDLYQREPDSGDPASQKSEFYFLYDQHNIYVGVRCFDEAKGISSKEMSRDGDLGEEDRDAGQGGGQRQIVGACQPGPGGQQQRQVGQPRLIASSG